MVSVLSTCESYLIFLTAHKPSDYPNKMRIVSESKLLGGWEVEKRQI